MDPLTSFEISLLLNIQRTVTCPFFDLLAPFLSCLDEYGIVWITAAVLLLIFRKTRKTGIKVLISLVVQLAIVIVIIKPIAARIRPFYVCPDLRVIVPKLTDFSFPSGHSSSSFAAAVAITADNKKLGIPALVLALLISLSRVYLCVHYPTDVLGGAAIGVLCGLAVHFACEAIRAKISHRVR